MGSRRGELGRISCSRHFLSSSRGMATVMAFRSLESLLAEALVLSRAPFFRVSTSSHVGAETRNMGKH